MISYHNIGGIVIKLVAEQGISLRNVPHVDEFRTNKKKEDAVVKVKVGEEYGVENLERVYLDENWIEVLKNRNTYFFNFIVRDKTNQLFDSLYVRLSENYCEINVIDVNMDKIFTHPLESTPFQIFFMLIARKFDSLLIHGSALTIGDQGLMFTGPSGSGKTSICRLCEEFADDSRIMIHTDETSLIRFLDDKVFVSGTPWIGSKSNFYKKGSKELKHVFFIEHGRINRAYEMNKPTALKTLMMQSFPFFWDKAEILCKYDLLLRLLSRIDYRRLAFLLDQSAVKYVIDLINR